MLMLHGHPKPVH
jgi:hypothetical protein